ncbi:hypothetical protein KOY48_05180 [Candidatus Minimicrobia naudis]|uniref:Uncharacterized protein n=1 Tax=Candidatus Minimicrobia naudis TaxID=2841263 RepID=A0A8F1MC96_9BACT|nr:hypothetical protein KOY48_05180 [Candidatus Minimicrobia naudis]
MMCRKILCLRFLMAIFMSPIVDSFGVCDGKFDEDAIIIVVDYANGSLPGAAKATDEWLKVNR